MSRAYFKCPHCGASTIVRTSYMLTDMIRESFHVCTNLVCGHTFASLSEIVRTISPSSMPRADVEIPISTKPKLKEARERIEQFGQAKREDADA